MSNPTFGDYGLLGQDVGFGYLDQELAAPRRFNPQLVLNDDQGTVLQALRAELRTASSFTFSVAFVTPAGIAAMKQALIDFRGTGEIITSTYLGFNSPAAFHELLALRELGISVRRHHEGAYHPKGYVFRRPEGVTVILGSSNLTNEALVSNHEWNIRVTAATDSDLAEQFMNLLDREAERSVPLEEGWVADYAATWTPPVSAGTPTSHGAPESAITPNRMQEAALSSIASLREAGAKRGLVISATGTGKTILAALDVRATNPERVLFVAHREQILDRALEEFHRVLGGPRSDFGKFVGQTQELDRRFVFSTVQTLSRSDSLASLDPDTFDYILIDEVHRATADTYQRVIEHFEPEFLLGLTATPERTDGTSVFELFHYNVPYEIRLGEALEQEMLAPFHYYGISDITFEDGTTTTDATPLFRLISEDRIEHLLRTLNRYGQAGVAPRGLIFCSRKEEARELSRALNQRQLRGRTLRTVALTGDDSIAERERQVVRLEAGDLDYILTVDVFNEGVDIPSVNQVIMLRQTQLSIVFVQQLGRGLRKAPGKDYLVVIDFIGNYTNNYLIPIALFGDDSLNRESIRRSLIAAEERGAVPGTLSSVQFDRIAHERVLRSIQSAKLDSLHNLKVAIETIRNRLGRMPKLQDFLRFESVDPIILATKVGSYPELTRRLFQEEHGIPATALPYLAMISGEILTAKRLHESVLLTALLRTGTMSEGESAEVLEKAGLPLGPHALRTIIGGLTLEWNTQGERQRYKQSAPVEQAGTMLRLAAPFADLVAASPKFRHAVEDVLLTAQRLNLERYELAEPFTHAAQYSRKDASRLLNWSTNMYSTIYGYRVDLQTGTCPIFVTLHKQDEVSASTAYEDALIDPHTMVWYTRSKRTLNSDEVRAIVQNSVELHAFVKKDDAEGSGHYYLGRATAHDAEQTVMSTGEKLPVVRMLLKFDQPIDSGVFSYFHPALTD